MARGKKSLVEDKNPPKRRGANRRKAKSRTSPVFEEIQQDWPRARTKRPRKSSAVKRKRSGGAHKERGKRVASAKAPTQRRA